MMDQMMQERIRAQAKEAQARMKDEQEALVRAQKEIEEKNAALLAKKLAQAERNRIIKEASPATCPVLPRVLSCRPPECLPRVLAPSSELHFAAPRGDAPPVRHRHGEGCCGRGSASRDAVPGCDVGVGARSRSPTLDARHSPLAALQENQRDLVRKTAEQKRRHEHELEMTRQHQELIDRKERAREAELQAKSDKILQLMAAGSAAVQETQGKIDQVQPQFRVLACAARTLNAVHLLVGHSIAVVRAL